MKRFLLLTLATLSLCLAPKGFSQKLLGTIPIGGQPGFLAVNIATNVIYAPNSTLNTLTVIDARTDKVTANIPVAAGPYAVAVNPTTNVAYVTSTISPAVTVIDCSSYRFSHDPGDGTGRDRGKSGNELSLLPKWIGCLDISNRRLLKSNHQYVQHCELLSRARDRRGLR
jgi:YVTN family beta-propeller protein